VFSVIPFGVLAFGFWGVKKLSDYVGDRSVSAQTGFYLFLAGALVITVLLLFVRLWFDVAQVRAVVQDEHVMWRNLWKALGISRHHVVTLFRVYLCIPGVAWVSLALGLYLWAKLPPTTTPLTFLLLEFIVLMQLLTRLWQRASAVTWYKRHAPMFPADAADHTTPAPIELVESMAVLPESASVSGSEEEAPSDEPDAPRHQE
jgi:hypothetical protein